MGSANKALIPPLIPITGVVVAVHAVLLWGLPALDRTPDLQDTEAVVMQTRTVQAEPPPPPPPPPAPPPQPARPPAPKPRPKPPVPQPAQEPAPEPVPESEPNPGQTQAEKAPAAPDTEAQAADTPAPAEAPAPPEKPPQPADEHGTAQALQVTPAGAAAPLPPGTELPVALPGSATLEFEARGQVKGFQYSAGAELLWKHDDQYYEARQSISMFLLGERSQISQGLITPRGLQPLSFTDRGRKNQSARFDVAQGKASFSDGTPEAPISDGVQDRLSVFLQLSALLAADPKRYPQGTVIELTTSSARAAARWRFAVGPSETLELPAGSVEAIRLDKLADPQGKSDQPGSLWLAPSMQYLPVRIRLNQGQNDYVDLRLKRYEPQ
ncbi:hypothetical protein GCM10010975_22240 [Comamonas phosphati]|nr:hypothetical protein GCM10010975_22240 [Comamonas phosphati]